MRTPMISKKRALGLSLSAALAIGATVSLAGSSQAAVAKYTLGSATTSVSQAMTVKGTDFTDDGGAENIDLAKIDFETGACPTSKASVSSILGTSGVAVTDTKITLVTPSVLALTNSKPTKYNVCFYDKNSNTQVGTATVTVYTAPSVTASVAPSGPSYGGGKITITGQDFTTKTGISVGGAAATGVKVTLGKTSSDPDTVVGLAPVNNGQTPTIKVTGEAGNIAFSSGSGIVNSYTYAASVKVTPAGSDGTAGRTITVDGAGFNALSFQDTLADLKSTVILVKAGTALTTSSTFYGSSYTASSATTYYVCAGATVVSDTELTCTIPDLTGAKSGAYTVGIVTFTAAHALNTASSTGFSRDATYTSATF